MAELMKFIWSMLNSINFSLTESNSDKFNTISYQTRTAFKFVENEIEWFKFK